MQRRWSYLFGAVMVAAAGLVLVAPWLDIGWWLPRNVSSFGSQVDGLFYLILGITGFFFILTEGLLVYFIYTYSAPPEAHEHPVGHHYSVRKVFWTSFFKRVARPVAAVIHNQHRLELFWTLAPGAILVLIAFVQVRTWADIKYSASMPKPSADVQQMQVDSRQFEWRIRYPSPERYRSWQKKPDEKGYEDPARFGAHPHADDVWVVNELHVYRGADDNSIAGKVLITLTSEDVVHSLFVPNLRLKQAALPGKLIPVWFKATAANTKYNPQTHRWEDGWDFNQDRRDERHQIWEVACTELCGWGHYKMRGRLYVHESREDFQAWLQAAAAEQNRHTPAEIGVKGQGSGVRKDP